MATGENRLTDSKVRSAKAGKLEDGKGLRLVTSANGSKRWILRFTLDGKRREMGLGSFPAISLAEARSRASVARSLVAKGIDPIESRPDNAERMTPFREVAHQYIFNVRLPTWKHGRYGQHITDDFKGPALTDPETGKEYRRVGSYQQWVSTLEEYVYPVIGDKPVDQVNLADVTMIIEPIWLRKTETAVRIRERIKCVLDYAKAKGLRDASLPNPAAWQDNLQELLPSPDKVAKTTHQPSLPYKQLPAFWKELQEHGLGGVGGRALAFTILCGVRTGATRFARWSDLNLKQKVWTVPAEHNKAGVEIDIPLREPMLAIINEQKVSANSDWVFPQLNKPEKPISENAMMDVVKRLGYHHTNPQKGKPSISVHGFRSSAREWLATETTYASDVAETFLGHKVGTKVSQAYFRSSGKAYVSRRAAQEDWCRYLTNGAPAKYAPKPPDPDGLD